ncbi:tyrosine-type recombinase/integrase [Tissierella sp. Yu-01]|uniref:tyrosine-type recombinase/integrase n=1 Tax=Tissierella sp. Yu-01 TaxID=3035694 RepID=UPI00240CED86|nr:tyrosine-type recombinase/integrase [Tissierella sp. Yu-01]WFA09524.1 tyrosine-type recombinase/integrase [Tissierella sp. Yu-01]
MASGHIRKREYKSGVSWQIVIENGVDSVGNRIRKYKTVKGTKKEAQKVMTKMLNELNNGTFIEPTKTTLGQYMKEWMETYIEPNLSPTTLVSYKANVDGHIIPKLGHIPIQNLNAIDIQRFYNELSKEINPRTKKPLSARTIEHIHANLKSALKQAVKLGLIEKNPADATTIQRAKDYKATVYDEDEVKNLFKYVKGTRLEVPVVLAVGLGLRRGEVLGLRWSSIDFKEKKIKIETSLAYVNKEFIFKSPKSAAGERTLVMPESLIELLKKHHKEQSLIKLALGESYQNSDLVCCKEDGSPIIPGTFSHIFTDFLKDYGLKEIRFHDLRHTHASLLLKYGIAAKVASTRLGHSSIGITLDLYSHIYSEAEVEVANKIESGIFQNQAI